jgi:16S rRNA processing protein RimM
VTTRRHRSSPRSRSLEQEAKTVTRWVALGAVMGAHGLRGGLRVKQHNPDSELLLTLPEIALRLDGELRVYALTDVRPGGKGLLMSLRGIDSIEAAQLLRGAELCVPRSWLPALAPGEYYVTDLPGLAVVTSAGEPVGTVASVLEYPSARALRVEAAAGVWEIPLLPPYLVEVDVEAGRVIVDDLADLELEPSKR